MVERLRGVGVVDIASGDVLVSQEDARRVLGSHYHMSRFLQPQIIDELVACRLLERVNKQTLVIRAAGVRVF